MLISSSLSSSEYDAIVKSYRNVLRNPNVSGILTLFTSERTSLDAVHLSFMERFESLINELIMFISLKCEGFERWRTARGRARAGETQLPRDND